MASLPTSAATPEENLRLTMAVQINNGKVLAWVGFFIESKAAAAQQRYGDLNIGSAVTDSSSSTSVSSTTSSFQQDSGSGTNEVDIFWVIDNSGSMSEEQTNLELGADQFFDTLGVASIDYRLAVTTTDSGTCTDLRTLTDGISLYIDNSTPDAKTEWVALASPGTSGDSSEFSFYCANAVDISGFDRQTAADIVVFVSDEPENETYRENTPDGAAALRDLTAYRGVFQSTGATYFAIVGTARQTRETFADSAPGANDPDYSCNGDGGNVRGGANFGDIVQLTGGSRASICSDEADWSVMFSEVLQVATGLASAFELDEVPLPGSIVVTVDGNPVARDTSRQDGFDVVLGSSFGARIVFYGNAVPVAGASVNVSYDS